MLNYKKYVNEYKTENELSRGFYKCYNVYVKYILIKVIKKFVIYLILCYTK